VAQKTALFPQKQPLLTLLPIRIADGDSGNPGYVNPAPSVSEPKTKHKKMKRNTYYPSRQGDQVAWLLNYANKLPGYVAVLNLATVLDVEGGIPAAGKKRGQTDEVEFFKPLGTACGFIRRAGELGSPAGRMPAATSGFPRRAGSRRLLKIYRPCPPQPRLPPAAGRRRSNTSSATRRANASAITA
jgi:hypothetical protein